MFFLVPWNGGTRPVAADADFDLPTPGKYPGRQKAVYQITSDGGWFGRAHLSRLGNLQNHFNAYERGALEIEVVLYGDGVSLLTDAVANAGLRDKIDALRSLGARFVVCRATMAQRGLGVGALYGLQLEDVVISGVAEIAHREQNGYVYLRL
jgi:intracellular sulfur oxidation DsrE/DsrF family protein